MGMLGYGGRNRPTDARPVGVYWAEDGSSSGSRTTPTSSGCRRRCPASTCSTAIRRRVRAPDWDAAFAPKPGSRQSPCCSPPIVRYQGDLLEATFDSEPIGQGDETSLLYTTFKSPDYTGHVYGMFSDWTGLQLEAVDAEIGTDGRPARRAVPRRVRADRDGRPRAVPPARRGRRRASGPDPAARAHRGRVRRRGQRRARAGRRAAPRSTSIRSSSGTKAAPRSRTSRPTCATTPTARTSARTCRASAIEQDLLDEREFAAVFATTYMATLADLDTATFGETAFADGDYPMPAPTV